MKRSSRVLLFVTLAAALGPAVLSAAPTAENQTNALPVLSARWNVGLSYSDRSGLPLTFTLLTPPGRGSLGYWGASGFENVLPGDPIDSSYWYYTATGTESGTDSFTWEVSDGASTSGVATVTLELTNNAPITAQGSTNTTSEGAVRAYIWLNHSDPDWAQPKTAQLVAAPALGVLEYDVNSSGGMGGDPVWTAIAAGDWIPASQWNYTPTNAGGGRDAFQWRITDGIVTSDVVEAVLVINSNTPPVANNQSYSVVVGAVRYSMWLNATDPDSSQTKTFQLTSAPGRGMLEYSSGTGYVTIAEGDWVTTQNWRYSPSGFTTGSDSLQWRVSDGMATSSPATVSITLTANNAPVAKNQSMNILTNTVRKLTSLSYTHSDSYQPVTYWMTSPPAKGFLEYNDGSGYAPVPTNVPISMSSWYYTGDPPDYTGTASFQWRMSDGIATSGTATCTYTITTNRPPVAGIIRATVLPGTNVTFKAQYRDPDAGQSWTVQIVKPADNGTLTLSGVNFTYTPTNSFTGTDTFSYQVNDGVANSAVAPGFIQVRPASDRAGNLVLLIVNNVLLPVITNEVDRMRVDLENEGYTARIKSWSLTGNSNSSNLWAYINSEWQNTNQFLQGAILIGDVPKAQTYAYHPYYGDTRWLYTDLIYWNMLYFQNADALSTYNIWVTRMNADDTAWGAQDVLIRRALDANHDYRTGRSRLPHMTYVFDCFTTTPATNTMWDVWPGVRGGGGGDHNAKYKFMPERTDLNYAACDAFVAGGEAFNETSHGNASGYMEGSWFDETALYRVIAQQRFGLIGSCTSGAFGGIVNNHIFTRGGGLIMAVGGTDINYSGDFQINRAYGAQVGCRARLAVGDSWGGACLYSYPFENYYTGNRIVFYGDFSIGAMASPSNAMPVISSLTASTTTPVPGEPVTFSVKFADPDAGVTNSPFVDFQHQVEWFPEGYNSGRATPACVTNENGGAGWTNFTYTFATAGARTLRVEVMDEWQARVWKELTINVNSRPVASNDAAGVVAGLSVAVPVLENDYDPDGQAISIQSRTAPAHGTATIGGGLITYTSTNAWEGVDTFNYVIADTLGATATGTVSVTVALDTVAPVISQITCAETNLMRILFSKAMDPVTAQNAAHYALNHGATVLSAILGLDGRTVTLLTSPLVDGLVYEVTVNGVTDDRPFSPNPVAVDTRFDFICRTVTGHGMDVTFGGYDRGEALTNFPALLALSEALPGFDYSQFLSDRGWDLRLTSGDGSLELPYEVERWDTNGTSLVWVRLPVLTNGTSIRMEWGLAGQTNPVAGTTNGLVWASEFRNVHHFADSGGHAADSTANRNVATNSNVTYTNAGVVGGAAFIDSETDFYRIAPLTNTTLTASLWYYYSDIGSDGGWNTLLCRYSGGYHHLLIKDDTRQVGTYNGAFVPAPAVTLALSNWYHFAVVMTGSTYNLYMDGQQILTNATAFNNTTYNLSIVSTHNGSAQAARGRLDELRVETVTRSSNWVWATWMNQASNAVLCQYGAVAVTGNPAVDAFGVPDAWKTFYFGSPTAPQSGALDDWDGDGMSNWAEWRAGTSPVDILSCLMFRSIGSSSGGLGLDFDTLAGLEYQVLWKSNLLGGVEWDVWTNFLGTGDSAHVVFPGGGSSNGFFRIRMNP